MESEYFEDSYNEHMTHIEQYERSCKLLFQSFCNNLYLGQWQLARACTKELQGRFKEKQILDILKDVVSHPFNRSVLSSSVSSPCHLSWLCLLEFEQLSKQESEKQVDDIVPYRNLVEFHLLLIEVCPHITDTVLKEVYLYYKWIHSASSSSNSLNLSPSLLKYLQTLLSRLPHLGHTLIITLYNGTNSQLAKNNKALLFVYINSINSLLDSLVQEDLDDNDKTETTRKIYKILAYFDPGSDVSELPLRLMFSKILDYCKHEKNYICKTKVISVLIGHSENRLLEEFCRLDYEQETNNAVATYQTCAELTEEQRWILYLSSLSDINTRWKMFYLMSIKNKKHVLEMIMETGLSLIKCNMFDGLQRLIEPVELHPLKPLLLLLGWTYCYSSTEARQLLQTLWTQKSDSGHPAITMGCNKLAYQIDLIQWCLEKARPLLSEESAGPQFQRAADLFKGLESHSILYMLHSSTKLSALDQQEVLDLLQKIPLQGSKDVPAKMKKTVRFQEEASTRTVRQVTSLDQQKDMAIYTGYCVLKNVMDAILFCSESSDDRLTNPVRSRSRRKASNQRDSRSSSDSRSRSESLSASCDKLDSDVIMPPEQGHTGMNPPDLQTLYKENVTVRLTQVKSYLARMQPLTFRVEILEDIFSLLFLSHEDIQEDLLLSEYNSDDVDDRSGRSASTGADTPLQSPQKESSIEFKLPIISIAETGSAYDIPFEEVVKSDGDRKKAINMEKVGEMLETVKLKISESMETATRERQHHSSLSENISSMSTNSSINLTMFGFIVNEYLVRDILALLKDCILDVSAAKYQIHGNKGDGKERYRPSREVTDLGSSDIDSTIEEALCRLVKSSVTMDTLQKRITQLERYTSEAHWRYQLVTSEHMPKGVGEILQEPRCGTGDSSDEEVEIRGLGAGQKSKRRKKSVSRSSKPCNETAECYQSDSSVAGDTVKRQTSRSLSITRQPGGQVRTQSLISLMLSTPVTLLTMSIRRNQTTQTKQIVKLFKLEERPEAVEVYFSQAYHKASRSVQSILSSGPTASGTFPGKPSMKSLANVAAAGVATASISNIADELLTFPALPQIPKLENDENVPQNIARNFESENLAVMILLDLLCSSAKSWEVCNHLLNAIKSRQPAKSSADIGKSTFESKVTSTNPKQRVHKIRTFTDIVAQIQSLMQLGADDQFPRQEQTAITRTFQKSTQTYLCQAVYILSSDMCKDYAILCQNMTKYIDRAEEAFEQHKLNGSQSPDRQRLSSSDKFRSRADSRQDQPVLHHCMKQLITILDKELPTGGLVPHIARSTSCTQNKNYLLSLYEHCKELSYLVAESESQTRETVIAPKNYFDMLNEGPLRILGRMMFTKKMPPAKLERVALKLSLNLTHIIVYSCCMKVPSKRLPVLSVHSGKQEYQVQDGKVIYNCTDVTVNNTANPEEFLRTLLMRLVNLMKDIASRCNAESLFDVTCADLITNTTEYNEIIMQTSLLQSVDLLHLEKLQRKCFYGNLQTLMSIHCFVNHVQTVKSQRSGSQTDADTNLQHMYSEMSVTEQLTFLNTFSYRLSHLGVVSLFDLKYQLNRNGLEAPSEWGSILKHRIHLLDETDPWFQLGPSPDSQLLFSMTTCGVSSPPIQILDPGRVREQLNTSMRKYLQASVHVDKERKVIKIPELLLWHRRDFICSQPQLKDFTSDTMGLVEFISSYLTGDKEKDIKLLTSTSEKSPVENKDFQSLSKLPFDVEVIPNCKEFTCVFDFESIACAESHHHSSKQSSSQKNGSWESTVSDLDITYNLTPNTLEYIKSDCPLVATLVSLVCSDEFDEEDLSEDAFDDTHFNASLSSQDSGQSISKRSRAASSMSLVDIRSYRYEKLTNEYPTLKRHLLNYIVPLAATEDHDILKGDDPILKLLTSEIIERFKSNMLSLHESSQFKKLLTGLLKELFKLRKWMEILQVIDSIPVTVVRCDTSLVNVHDFVVCCFIHTQCSTAGKKSTITKEKSALVMSLLHRVIGAETQAHEVLAVHRKLQIDHNMDLFDMCLCNEALSTHMREILSNKFMQIKVFYRITECAKNLQFKLSLRSTDFITEEDKTAAKKRHLILDQFTDWHTVAEWTKSSPREVLGLLIKTGDFDTAKSWSQLEKLDVDIKMEIEEHTVTSLLNAQPTNTTKAFMVLEDLHLKQCSACVSMCRKFVSIFHRQQDVMFVVSYMLNQLSAELTDDEKERLRLTHIGARMILSLPESMHTEYSHLVDSPRFILEQLLMNMKPELAGKAFQTVKEEFCLIQNPANIFTVEQFNTLVNLYAKKALEFTVVQYLEPGDKERSFSTRSTSSDKLDPDQTRSSPLLRHSPQPRPMDSMLTKKKSVDLQGASRLALNAPSGTTGSPGHKMVFPTVREKFIMPAEPPPRDQWVADSSASVCMVCKVERFSMFNRRHHCRRCGRVVCAACSSKVTLIKGINARTCDDCYSEIFKSSEQLGSADDLQQYRTPLHMSGSSRTSTPHSFLTDGVIQEEQALTLSEVVSHTHTTWKLQTDDTFNSNLREDFYFEQAPSTSLCISILNLHGNPRECGQLILNLCDDLSKYLKPLAPGVPNPEVDYNLIMSMMKYLLFHAKIKFTKCGNNAGMGKCDIYQGLVDLLGLLVVDNYRDLPSIQELTKMDTIRRLRDKLIGDERLSLAMEVSTKCGLDPTGVWVAWGFTCLQSGDFTGAREKYSKCLKPIKDKNVCSPMTKVLNDIIECLETMPGTGSMEIQVLLANPGSMKNLIMTPSSTFFEEASMDSQQFQECVFYLKSYGSYLSLVDFHRRHGYYMKAVQYVLDHRCSTEVFIDGLLKPSVETGELGRLTDQMLMIDKSLERWNNYLTASCRYLVKNKLHHVLYDFQLFMKDYIRAGMTCFTYFYQEGAQNYLDLSRRIQYLFTAQQHMQAYLDPAQWGNVQHPLSVPQRQSSWEEKGGKGEPVSVRLVKGTDEVKRYIRTIALQIEVTKFLQACLIKGKGEAASTSSVGSSKVPTLFASQQVRNDLAIMIMLSGDDIESSFALATRMIKEYKLGAVGIYTHAAREMAKGHRYEQMRLVLNCVDKAGMGSDDVMDEILGACLLVVADNPKEAKEADNIIKLLRKDGNKINAFILCGKLRSAYLMAVKENRVDDVRRILRAAKTMGQATVINICNKWLEQNQHT